jgi:hypothetical protein
MTGTTRSTNRIDARTLRIITLHNGRIDYCVCNAQVEMMDQVFPFSTDAKLIEYLSDLRKQSFVIGQQMSFDGDR